MDVMKLQYVVFKNRVCLSKVLYLLAFSLDILLNCSIWMFVCLEGALE